MKKSTEVLVIGGGATGCGLSSMIWPSVALSACCLSVEGCRWGPPGGSMVCCTAGDATSPTIHRRPASASQRTEYCAGRCPHAIEDTGGLFVTTPWDPPEFADQFYRACLACDIPVEEISPAEMLQREPLLNPAISRAFTVPDATVDTWDACRAFGRYSSSLRG